MAGITFDDIRGKAAKAHGASLPKKIQSPPAPHTDAGFSSIAAPKFSDILKSKGAPPEPRSALTGAPIHVGLPHWAKHTLNVTGDMAGTIGLQGEATVNSLVSHPLRSVEHPKNLAPAGHIEMRHGKVVVDGTHKQQVEAASMLSPSSNEWLRSAQEIMGVGPGMALLAGEGVHHPVGTAKSVVTDIGKSIAGTFTHGHYGTKNNTPLDDVMNLWTVATLGAGGVVKLGDVAGADSLKGAAKAAVTRHPQVPRVLRVGEGEHARNIYAPASNNPAAALLQRKFFDRILQHSVNSGHVDLGGVMLRRFGSAEARMARHARGHLRVENEIASAPGLELSRLGQGVTKRAARGKLGGLTMAQQHAAFIASLGHTPEQFARMSEHAIEHADHLAQLEGVPADVIRHNHEDMLAKTKLSAQYFNEHGKVSHPLVQHALEAMQRAIGAREDVRGMTAEEVHHALGSRWHAVNHLAENPTGVSLHQELPGADEARQAAIHGEFRAKGKQIHDEGAFYLPQSSETKPLARMRQGITRRPGPYGFAAPKGEATHAQMGHLFNTGDFRTSAVPLAQHAFGKSQHLQAMQRLHEMLLALSKKSEREVGHAHPVPIRVKGAPGPELKRTINELYQGDVSKAEGESAQKLWEHFLPGHVPQGEDVRWLHPDIAAVFKPHQVGQVARNFNRFNQLVRAQRFLNPKYATWNVQNAAIGLADQGALMPANAVRYVRVIRKLDPETYSKIESSVGAGMSKNLAASGDSKAIQTVAAFWHHVNDHAYRMMQFVHDARRVGVHTADQFKTLMNSDDPSWVAKRHAVIQNANRNAIDYGATTPLERATVQRFMAYWPWTRGASAWTLRLLREHPVLGEGELEAGRKGKKYVDQFFRKHGGMVPPNLEGSYPAHGGPIDMEALNTGSTLGQVGEALSGITNPKAAKYLTGTFLGQSAPAVKGIEELTTGLTKFGSQPKNGSVLGQTLHDMTSGILPLQLGKELAGKGPRKGGLSPSGVGPEALKWAGWPQERGVNYEQLAQYGASINKKSLRGIAQEASDTQQNLTQVDQLAKTTKLPPGYEQGFKRYWSREGARNANIVKAAWDNGDTSDDYKKAMTALGFDHPDLYLLATAKTIAGLYNRPDVVKIAEKTIASVSARKDITDAQRTTYLRTRADNWWNLVNPKTIKSAYYKLRDRANLN